MALTACYTALKYIVVLLSFVFWLIGLAALGVATWSLVDGTGYLSVAQDESTYITVIYALLIAGALMFIIGFLGCCGAFKESPCFLVSFFCILLIVVVAEVSAGVWCYTNVSKDDSAFKKLLESNVKATVQTYDENGTRNQAFDSIQKHLQCCGAQGPMDWHQSAFNKYSTGKGVEMTNHAQMSNFTIPKSCCKANVDAEQCKAATKTSLGALLSNFVYPEGCSDKLYNFLLTWKDYVWAILALVLLVQILGLLLSLLLCCAVRSVRNHYKS